MKLLAIVYLLPTMLLLAGDPASGDTASGDPASGDTASGDTAKTGRPDLEAEYRREHDLLSRQLENRQWCRDTVPV